jgi:NAD(P)-dependent dehydrogenase (short-subunit alcohol dehydrogenase family)
MIRMSVDPLFDLKGKKAVVTGSGRGIGRTLALALAARGVDVVIADLILKNAEAVAAEARDRGVQAVAAEVDVTDPKSVDALGARIEDGFGRLDIAVNNAGIVVQVPAEDMTFDDWKRVVDVNLTGVFLTAQMAGRLMIRHRTRGAIVNTASMSAHIVNWPQPQCSYNASKAGVVQLTKSLAVEWAPHGIRVNCISPGYINTELTSFVREDWKKIWVERTVTSRLGETGDLVSALVFIVADSAAFVTGTDLVVDGAFTCI